MVQVRRVYWDFRFCGFGYFLDQFYVGGHASRITPETSTLQCGTLTSISLRTMASNLPHVPATEEAQGPHKAIVDCVAFLCEEGPGKGGENLMRFCGYQLTPMPRSVRFFRANILDLVTGELKTCK